MKNLKKILVTILIFTLWGVTASASGVSYEYDDLGRLTKVTYDNGTSGNTADDKTVTYSYDAAGNRTQHVVEGTDLTYASSRVIVLPLNGFIVLPLPGPIVGN